MRLGEPIGLGLGRNAWNMFQAICDWEAAPRVLGATGITISVYIFDGTLAGPRGRHVVARHQLYYSTMASSCRSPFHAQACATYGVVPLRCIAHSCSNSVAWGLHGLGLKSHSENIHIAIQSLLNGRTALHSHVGDFLQQHLFFSRDRSGSCEEISMCWRSLQIEPHFVDQLRDLDLHWDGSVLRVHDSWSHRSDAIDTISACVVYLLSWCSFSETRWAKVGVCGRRYIGSLCAGLDALWAESPDDDFSYGADQLGSYRMGLEYLDFVTALPTESESFKKCIQVNEMLPKEAKT